MRQGNIQNYPWQRGKLSALFSADAAATLLVTAAAAASAIFTGHGNVFNAAIDTVLIGGMGTIAAAMIQEGFLFANHQHDPFNFSALPVVAKGQSNPPVFNAELKAQAKTYETFNRNLAIAAAITGIGVAIQDINHGAFFANVIFQSAVFLTSAARFADVAYNCSLIRQDRRIFHTQRPTF